MPIIVEAITRNDYSQLVHIAEQTDLASTSDRQQSRLLIVAPLVLGHLVLDDLTLARYALLRLPDNLASLPLPRALMALVISAMNRQHAAVYDQAGALRSLVLHPDFIDKDLASIIANLLSAFIEHFRRRTFSLLSKAYTSLPLSLACNYLSMPAEQVVEVAQTHSWLYDLSTQILSPEKGKPDSLSGPISPSFSSLATFGFVADSVARLEV